ncbi:hypothetical protein [Rodentibacter myodis]|uniref:hypothetical protein n=1 Tax=Rodentibacter myodis TaxID=1907939 RepID=UPI00269F09E3
MLITMLSYGDYDRINPWFVQFIPSVFEIKKDSSIIDREDITHYFNYGKDPYFDNRIIDNPNSREIYPYYDKDKILARAYEKSICKKEPIKGFINKKTHLYNKDFIVTNSYLIKGDNVSILDEKIDEYGEKWYFINYKGKKEINMWIKADSVDLN